MNKQLLYLFLICIPIIGFSQDETTQETQNPSWEWNLTPYIWMTGMSGDISVLNQTVPLDVSFKDILKNLKMAAMIHTEAKNGKWSVMLDIVYAKLESSGEVQGLMNESTITGTVKQTILELGAAYSFVEVNNFTLDALFGVRYYDLKLELDFETINTIKKCFNFTDPYVGVRLKNSWDKFGVGGRFDLGGFGIGSDISYKYNVYTEYKFSELFQLQFGYQGYTPDYKNGKSFEYNVTSAGFVLGFNFNL